MCLSFKMCLLPEVLCKKNVGEIILCFMQWTSAQLHNLYDNNKKMYMVIHFCTYINLL